MGRRAISSNGYFPPMNGLAFRSSCSTDTSDSSSTAPSTDTSNKKSSTRTGVDFLSENIFSQDKIVDKLRSFATAKNVSLVDQ